MSWFQYSGFADEIDVRLENQITALQKFNIRNIELRSIDGKNITSHTLEEAKALKMRLNAGSVHVSAISKCGMSGVFQLPPHVMSSSLATFPHALKKAASE